MTIRLDFWSLSCVGILVCYLIGRIAADNRKKYRLRKGTMRLRCEKIVIKTFHLFGNSNMTTLSQI